MLRKVPRMAYSQTSSYLSQLQNSVPSFSKEHIITLGDVLCQEVSRINTNFSYQITPEQIVAFWLPSNCPEALYT